MPLKGKRAAVEIFEIDTKPNPPTFTWIGCAVPPATVNMNSISPVPDAGFVVCDREGRILAVALLIVKMAVYAGALFLCVTRNVVHPVGVFAGMTGVVFVLVLGMLWKGSAPAKEVT